ncbi:MAG: galactitol-1-phosphate 5-dehydrogenase, partial [Pirellulales bacterium]|nr:galactitol-1-phosphate 5-dehydrogenase [Pirellulales bacterium]
VGPDDVLVEVGACGICGSDIHGYDGSSGRRIPPLVMGHEAAGTVAEVGSSVQEYSVGARVTFDSMISCGKCAFCQRGEFNLCDNRQVLGVSCDEYRRHGAFAEYVVVPQRIVYAVPDDLALEHAAMIEPVSVAVHAVRRANVTSGDTAVVVGSGMIGLLVVQALRAVGCQRIIAVDLDDDRLALARRFGAELTFNPKHDDVVAEILKNTAGSGVDLAFEVVGATPTIDTAMRSIRKGGTLVAVGNLAPEVTVHLQSLVTREISLLGSCASSGEYPRCIELLSTGAIDVAPLITSQITLDETPAWFERLHAGEAGLMKVIVKP